MRGPHSTSYHWVRHLKRFCDWVGKSSDQLIEERKQQLKSDDQRAQHKAKMSLKRYLDQLQEAGLAHNTRKTCARYWTRAFHVLRWHP
jgi:hypothetical protein